MSKVINGWIFFALLLLIASRFPHWSVPFISWVNCSVYFLLVLLSFFIFKKDTNNKWIFFNISLLTFFYAVGFIQTLIGDKYAVGNNYLAYYFLEYRKIILSFLTSLTVIHITVRYIYHRKNSLFHYLLSTALTLPIFTLVFHDYLLDSQHILKIPDLAVFYKSLFFMDLIPLGAIIAFGILLYKYDKPIGEYINSIMVCFFILILVEVTDSFSTIYQIKLFNVSQYVLFINLCFFVLTLFQKLSYAYSPFGQFYETVIRMGGHYKDVPFERRKSKLFPLVLFLKEYFQQRRNGLTLAIFLIIFALSYFNVSLFVRLNIFVSAVGILTLVYYVTALYNKRVQKGHLLVNRHN